MKTLISKYGNILIQFIKFSIVGLSNTIISYTIYSALVFWGVGYLFANVVGFIISVLNSFYWNNKYVFEQREKERRSVFKVLLKVFISYSFTGLFINSILLIVWVDIIGLSEYTGPIINLLVTIPLNFVLNKLWAFKEKQIIQK